MTINIIGPDLKVLCTDKSLMMQPFHRLRELLYPKLDYQIVQVLLEDVILMQIAIEEGVAVYHGGQTEKWMGLLFPYTSDFEQTTYKLPNNLFLMQIASSPQWLLFTMTDEMVPLCDGSFYECFSMFCKEAICVTR